MSQLNRIERIAARWIDENNFKPYGQLITASVDGKPYDSNDAQLELGKGLPRFYIMRLHKRGRKFDRIARHVQCTQCLGSLEGKDWFIAVAPPSATDKPDIEKMEVFRIPGNCFIKLELGTWHAGPYFDWEQVDFYNLELSDTNVVDRFIYNFNLNDRLQFEII
ncbi:MAG: ureidoglycolate lyase [Prochloraceae cyanobacterium]